MAARFSDYHERTVANLLSSTMSSYLYELPTTGAISFSDFCYDQTASYVTEVAETTETRANLRIALKEYKRSGDDEKDYLSLVKVGVKSI